MWVSQGCLGLPGYRCAKGLNPLPCKKPSTKSEHPRTIRGLFNAPLPLLLRRQHPPAEFAGKESSLTLHQGTPTTQTMQQGCFSLSSPISGLSWNTHQMYHIVNHVSSPLAPRSCLRDRSDDTLCRVSQVVPGSKPVVDHGNPSYGCLCQCKLLHFSKPPRPSQGSACSQARRNRTAQFFNSTFNIRKPAQDGD